jgi:hypothetical protein
MFLKEAALAASFSGKIAGLKGSGDERRRNFGSPFTLRTETPVEVEYYRHGGIPPYLLRQLLDQA